MKRYILFLCIISTLLNGAEFYVSPEGNDTLTGTKEKPFKTFEYALSKLSIGDTLSLLEGEYHQRLLFSENKGPAQDILIRGVGAATLIGSGFSDMKTLDPMFLVSGKKEITIRNIAIKNTYGIGFKIYGNNKDITIDSCTVTNSYSSGILAWFGSNISITNNKLYSTCNWGEEEAFTPSDKAANGIQECISVSSVDTFAVTGNYLYRSGRGYTEIPEGGAEGIDAKMNSNNGIIARNHIKDISTVGIYADSYNGYLHDISIAQNIVEGCMYGIMAVSEKGGTTRNVMIENNIVHHNEEVGIGVWGNEWVAGLDTLKYLYNITVRHNTVTSSKGGHYQYWGDGIVIKARGEEADSIYIYNNIIYQCESGQIVHIPKSEPIKDIRITGNIEYGTKCSNKEGNSIEKPIFTDILQQDYSLQESSPGKASGDPSLAPQYDFFGIKRDLTKPVTIGAISFQPESIITPNSNSKAVTKATVKQDSNMLHIQFQSTLPKQVAFYNLRGQLLHKVSIDKQAISIPLSNISKGPSLMVQEFSSGPVVQKLFVQ